jgi:hypothetical protein
MRLAATCAVVAALLATLVFGARAQGAWQFPAQGHPDSTSWRPLFDERLSNAVFPKGVWTLEDGAMTASEDEAIWSDRDYASFALDLEFRTSEGANSGVVIYASDMKDWIPNSIEIQILDDFSPKWATAAANWQCGAIFGHQPPSKRTVRHAGEWNRMSVLAKGSHLVVVLNGERVNEVDLATFTSPTTNPDGTTVPEWLAKRSLSSLATRGRIGLQGKHAGAPIWFRHVRIREL